MKLMWQVTTLALLVFGSSFSSAKTLKMMVLYTVTECTELTAAEFQKSSGHKVIVHSLPTEDYLRIFDGDRYLDYDVYEIWYVMMPDSVKKGILLNLSNAFDKADLDDFFPNALEHYGYVGNGLYAIPYDGDCHFLYYRPSLLKKHHLTPPETWEDYFGVVKLVSEREASNGIWGTVLMANNNPFNVTTLFYNRLAWSGEIQSLTDAKIERALRAMKDISPYAHPDSLNANYKMTRALFLGGKVAMLEQYNDLSIRADDKTQSAIKGDWQAGMLPRWRGDVEFPTAMNGGFGLGVNKLSRNSKIAVDFVRFSTSPIFVYNQPDCFIDIIQCIHPSLVDGHDCFFDCNAMSDMIFVYKNDLLIEVKPKVARSYYKWVEPSYSQDRRLIGIKTSDGIDHPLFQWDYRVSVQIHNVDFILRYTGSRKHYIQQILVCPVRPKCSSPKV